jgi:hypothetical protein
MKKTMNKVIAATMMAITLVMPAMAGNKKYANNRNTTVVVVTNDKKASHFDQVDKKLSHFDNHRQAYRPDVKACTFKVSRHDSPQKVVAKAERMRGVMETKWNPRTRELTVFYDAKVTSPRHIMHFMA